MSVVFRLFFLSCFDVLERPRCFCMADLVNASACLICSVVMDTEIPLYVALLTMRTVQCIIMFEERCILYTFRISWKDVLTFKREKSSSSGLQGTYKSRNCSAKGFVHYDFLISKISKI